ncbi:MAG TPA: SEC59/DGK1/VTE5 family protein [Ignavibacteria bacterium]|nr:SEC59/DGK1/VTE5 family protein [Ignavibacteria bacterium]
MEPVDKKISIENELKRKLIHLSSSGIAIFYWFSSKDVTLPIIGLMFLISISLDLLRYFSPKFNEIFLKLFGKILRHHEIEKNGLVFSGSTCLLCSCLILIIFFPKIIAVMAILIMTVSDTAAALYGKNFGKIHIKNKTLEGSLAFFISGLFVIFLTPKFDYSFTEYSIAIFTLIVTCLSEYIPFDIDDNLTIPIIFATLYFLLFKLFLNNSICLLSVV